MKRLCRAEALFLEVIETVLTSERTNENNRKIFVFLRVLRGEKMP